MDTVFALLTFLAIFWFGGNLFGWIFSYRRSGFPFDWSIFKGASVYSAKIDSGELVSKYGDEWFMR